MATNSDNFDLTDWKLTLPVDSGGGTGGTAVEVKNLVGYEDPGLFYYAPDGAMVFAAAVDGATTSGSKYARTELREMNGSDKAAWTLGEGGTMTATLQVDSVPTKLDGSPGRIIVGQIHGQDEELVRLYYDNNTLYFMNDQAGSSNTETKFLLKDASGNLPNVSLNENFSYLIDARGDTLTVEVYADGKVYSSQTKINAVWQPDTFYFKAGVYLGVNETSGTGTGQVSFYGLDFGHTPGSGLGGLTSTTPAPQPQPDPVPEPVPVPPPAPTPSATGAAIPPSSNTPGAVVGDAKANKIEGSSGDDILFGEAGNDTLSGRAGHDLLVGGDGNDKLYGGAGNDTIWGGAGNDVIRGEAGDDVAYGDAGNDSLLGGAGDDQLHGGAGNDKLEGNEGNDTLWGDAGADRLYGHDGDDILYGGDGNDTLYGGAGKDILYGGDGADTLYGGAGADIFHAGTDGAVDIIADYSANENDLLAGGATWARSGKDTLVYDAHGTVLFKLKNYDGDDEGILFAS